jgi:hypothetical protein
MLPDETTVAWTSLQEKWPSVDNEDNWVNRRVEQAGAQEVNLDYLSSADSISQIRGKVIA